MPQDALDMPDWASVEQELGRRRMTEDMRGQSLFDSSLLPVALKVPPEVIALETVPTVLADEEWFSVILSGLEIRLNPAEGSVGEEHHALSIALADHSGFTSGKVDAVAVQ
jgi:hypothetical protein